MLELSILPKLLILKILISIFRFLVFCFLFAIIIIDNSFVLKKSFYSVLAVEKSDRGRGTNRMNEETKQKKKKEKELQSENDYTPTWARQYIQFP